MNSNSTKNFSPTIVRFTDPSYLINQLEISPGSIAADFGCGAGFFSIPLAQTVGKNGTVYSLDILPTALEAVESKAKTLGIVNIITKRANLESEKGSGLPENSVDWVIMKDILFQNKNKEAILKEAYRILKPGGKSLIVEWSDKNLSIGPQENLRISFEMLIELIRQQKFSVEKAIDVGEFHYAVVVAK